MADKIDQLQLPNSQGVVTSYDITLPVDDKNAMFYTTASATANAFTVTIPGIDALVDGMIIHVKFNAATASGATLNVNNLGAKAIYYRTASAITTHISPANNYVTLVYDGTTTTPAKNDELKAGASRKLRLTISYKSTATDIPSTTITVSGINSHIDYKQA